MTYHEWLLACAQDIPITWSNPLTSFYRKMSMATSAWTADVDAGYINFNDTYKSSISIHAGHYDIGSQEAWDMARHVLSFLMPSPYLAYALVQLENAGRCYGGFDMQVFPTMFAMEHLNCIVNLQPFTMKEANITFDGHTLKCYGEVLAMVDYPTADSESDCNQAKLTVIPDHRYPPSMELAYAFGLYEPNICSSVSVITHLPIEQPVVTTKLQQPDVFNAADLFL